MCTCVRACVCVLWCLLLFDFSKGALESTEKSMFFFLNSVSSGSANKNAVKVQKLRKLNSVNQHKEITLDSNDVNNVFRTLRFQFLVSRNFLHELNFHV